MTETLDLDAYLERIGWGGGTRPTFDTLAGLLRAHMASIPFENLDVLLGRPVRLDLEGLQQKLVRARRGGYCFEHATLFAAVLETLGFRPERHTARVVLFAPRTVTPRTHMFLMVPLAEGTFIADPGFGGYKFFAGKFKKLREKNIDANFVQYVVYNNYEIQVLLIPSRGKEEHCFSVEQTNAAMALVHSTLTSQGAAPIPASKMFLKFDDQANCYVLYRIEHKDGSLSERV